MSEMHFLSVTVIWKYCTMEQRFKDQWENTSVRASSLRISFAGTKNNQINMGYKINPTIRLLKARKLYSESPNISKKCWSLWRPHHFLKTCYWKQLFERKYNPIGHYFSFKKISKWKDKKLLILLISDTN